MKNLYQRFVANVSQQRKMTPEAVEAVAQGRAWSGIDAKQNGLVDRIGGLQDAITVAREMAKIGTEDEVQVLDIGTSGLFKLDLPVPGLGVATVPAWLSLDWSGLLVSQWQHGTDTDESVSEDYGITYLRHVLERNGRPQLILPPDMLPLDGGDQ
jgi:ClpP class serine protease